MASVEGAVGVDDVAAAGATGGVDGALVIEIGISVGESDNRGRCRTLENGQS